MNTRFFAAFALVPFASFAFALSLRFFPLGPCCVPAPPTPRISRVLRTGERALGARAPLTWEEAELMEVNLIAEDGPADAHALGVVPQRLASVLAAA